MNFWERVRQAFATATDTAARPEMPQRVERQTGRRKRPASAALLRTMEMVRQCETVTAAEVAAEIGVTVAYARRLLRQARSNALAPASADVHVIVATLQERIAATEETLARLQYTPPSARASWNLHRRAEVLRLTGTGVAPREIAEALSIPAGEVEFIVKIGRLLGETR